MLKDHRFCQDLHRDLHPFSCYIISKVPREHPVVTNTTLSDRGLEGAFLGWDLSTPTVWLWSFRLKKPVRLHDPIFYDKLFPFRDPSVDEEVEDDPFTTQPTQPWGAVDPEILKPTLLAPTPSGERKTGECETGEPTAPCTRSGTARQPSQALPHTRGSGLDSESTSRTGQPSQALHPPSVPHIPAPDDIHTWIRGADVPSTASLDLLLDKQLGRALVHHKMILQVPKDWWIDPVTGEYTACTVLATACHKIAGHMYIDCQIVKPDRARREGQLLQLPVGKARGKQPLNLHKLLDLRFNNPCTLGDLLMDSMTSTSSSQTPSTTGQQ
mmetsp:Transcript_60384/g.124124  ORF Transcript_60384/g.124124 Transcript_60384/m.124124 type:complete len:327 (+) Transcript_60384:72-1052(+)